MHPERTKVHTNIFFSPLLSLCLTQTRGCGCILIEMLNGNSAFPGAKEPRGQLATIFAVFGCPTEETWPGISNFPLYEPERFMFYERRDLKTVFRELADDPDAEDLALKCLSLRPEFRISARDAMKHPYFRCLPPPIFRLPESE